MKASILVAFLLFTCAVFGADNKNDLCTLCHGAHLNGNVGVRAPKLAGQDRDYLARQLQAFRTAVRGTHALDVSGSEMRTIALSLSDGEVSKALDFVAKQKSEPPTATIQGDARRGENLYVTCAGCHGNRGEGNASLSAPALAQGNDWYWAIQLKNYRSGLRGTNSSDNLGGVMRAAAQALPDEQAVLDVVAYINSLR